jgi:hypothetical protein
MRDNSGKKKTLAINRVFFVLLALFLVLSGNLPTAAKEKISIKNLNLGHQEWIKPFASPDVILIPKKKSWLVPLILPYFQKTGGNKSLPVILVLPDNHGPNFERYLAKIKGQSILSFINPEVLENDYSIKLARLESISLSDSSSLAARQLSEIYSQPNSPVVLVHMNQPGPLIQASLFAATFSIPVIPFQSQAEAEALMDYVRHRNFKHVFLVTEAEPPKSSILAGPPVTRLSPNQVDQLIIEKLGAQNVRNLIISNPLPEHQKGQYPDANLAYYAPYISLLRKAPLVLSTSNSGLAAAGTTRAFIKTHGLVPKTITLLGDYDMISTVKVDESLRDQIYDSDMMLEPLSNPLGKVTIPFGIGRLPFSKIDCLSMYYARLAELEKKLTVTPPRFTMIANLASDKRSKLMLAEAISRATVKELRNFKLKGTEFYGESPHNPLIWNTALKSDLIIYEGHIEEFTIIKKGESPDKDTDHYEIPYFDQFPFLILQSCESLKSHEILLDNGISGIIGSCSKLHSASGSAFIKTFLDAMLYDGLNNGEALRDAKNYSLGIVKLKKMRGHKEQDKTLRSALTFRLMGDPESALFAGKLPDPARLPVKAEFVGEETIEIKTPHSTFPEVKNEEYSIKHFPKSEAAGIVTRIPNEPTGLRRINAFYFFRLPLLSTDGKNKSPLTLVKDESLRTITLADPFNRWIYLLHFPKQEIRNQKLRFQLTPQTGNR